MAVWYVLTVLKLVIFILWPITVSAAVATGAVDPFIGITGMHVLVMSVISTMSGLTALTIRIDAELRRIKNKALPRPILFVSSHMLGSWLAGILAVALAQHNSFGVWAQITAVIVASFSGAKFVEKVSEIYVNNIKKEVEQ